MGSPLCRLRAFAVTRRAVYALAEAVAVFGSLTAILVFALTVAAVLHIPGAM